VIGGSDTRDLSSCEKLDIVSNTWSGAASLSQARYSHCSVLFNNKVVVMGGGNLNTCEQYDPVADTWSSFPSLSTARGSCGAAVVLSRIYIAGGANSVEFYNGTSWSFLSSPLAQTRSACAAVAFQNKLVVLGGESITTIEVFDPVTSTWNTTFPPMKIAPSRYSLAAVSF
jgi:N-acetylneuraminic acid mutarotase